MDGRFDDWAGQPPAAPDDEAGLIRAVRISDDPHHVYVQIDLDQPRTLQWLEEELRLEFDLDGAQRTGLTGYDGMQGVEAVVVFSPIEPERGRTGPGATIYAVDRGGSAVRTTVDALGVVAMPTHSGDRFEIRLDRTPAFDADSFRLQCVTRNRDGVQDRTPVVGHAFATKASKRPARAIHDPAAPTAKDEIRVVSWNGEFGALFKNPAPFQRSFQALKPDIVLLQELPDKLEPKRVADWFDALDRNQTWTAGVGGQSLCVAVASPHPMEAVEELSPVRKFASGGRGNVVRATGGLVRIGSRSVLAVSIHLKCCGRLGSTEDQKRRTEVEAIHEAVRRAVERLKPDGLVIGGDFNLVGGPDILEALVRGLAPGNQDLVVSEPIRPCGDDTTTWGRPGESFVPGRLDFILYGGSMEATSEDILDIDQLGPSWRRKHRIPEEPPSDHLLIKTDLAWKTASPKRPAR
ncbi:MAG: endonuclease/exonuclease/phosphatase family protein [Planctomycetota bacterium]|nr:endonuclease/exonuclease/phosphatase family protein [Planctomycetota bacterium]